MIKMVPGKRKKHREALMPTPQVSAQAQASGRLRCLATGGGIHDLSGRRRVYFNETKRRLQLTKPNSRALRSAS